MNILQEILAALQHIENADRDKKSKLFMVRKERILTQFFIIYIQKLLFMTEGLLLSSLHLSKGEASVGTFESSISFVLTE